MKKSININFKMEDDIKLVCECGSDLFRPYLNIYKPSTIITGGKEVLVPKEVLVCSDCNKVVNESTKTKKEASKLKESDKSCTPGVVHP